MQPFRSLGTVLSLGYISVRGALDPQGSLDAQGINNCHGVSGNFRVLSPSRAVEYVKDFCSQNNRTMEYTDDLHNQLRLSVTRPGIPGNITFSPGAAPDCVGRFVRNIIDGCDMNDIENNPQSYKYGGTFVAKDGWVYSMKPLHKARNAATCRVNYQPSKYHVTISAKNIPFATLGDYGKGLLDNLRDCGIVEGWGFGYVTSGKWEWSAEAYTALGTKPCVIQALQAVGVEKAGCGGTAN